MSSMFERHVDVSIDIYRPEFIFHSQEDFFPVDPVDYVQRASLLTTPEFAPLLPPSNINVSHLPAYRYGGTTLSLPEEESKAGSLDAPLTVHTHIEDDSLFIQYVPFYAFNGPVSFFGCITLPKNKRIGGAHQADLEDVIVELDRDTFKLKKIYLSEHGDHSSYDLSDLEVNQETGRFKVYVAWHSHAHYPRAGKYRRFYGVTSDYTDEGQTWNPNMHRVFDEDHTQFNPHTMGHIAYGGDMGHGHVAAFKTQSFWKGKPSNIKGPHWPSPI